MTAAKKIDRGCAVKKVVGGKNKSASAVIFFTAGWSKNKSGSAVKICVNGQKRANGQRSTVNG